MPRFRLERRPPRQQGKTMPDAALRRIGFLAIPTLLIATGSIVLLPWLLETRRRLQNDFWEDQLAFAITALAVAAAGVPFVCLRCAGRFRFWSTLGWTVIASGYLLLVLFTLQSHFTPFNRLFFSACGIACLRWSIQGLLLDRAAAALKPGAAAGIAKDCTDKSGGRDG